MPKAKKLPSGNWRVRVYDKQTKLYKSFTAETKREAEFLGSQYLNSKTSFAKSTMSVKTAVLEYIENRKNILSPSTVRSYKIICENALGDLSDIRLDCLTESHLQAWVNQNTLHYAPKSVKSQYGLIRAVLKQNKIVLDYDSILLPRIIPKEKAIPSEEEIAIILHIIEGTSVELPVTIAVTLGLRQSEIGALKWSDYDGNFLVIHSAQIPNADNKYVIKEGNKSAASTRKIEVGDLLKERLDRAERVSEYISPMLPSSVLRKFQHILKKNGLPKFTMHEQRHGNASLMLAKGVPDKYAMKRLGQSSPNMIKNVYQHLYENKEREISNEVSKAFSDIYDTKYDTK